MFTNRYAVAAVAVFGFGFAVVGMAQQARQYAKKDYAGAERFMPYNVLPLASAGVVCAKWLDDGRFWYRDTSACGWDYLIVDPAKKTKLPAFDQATLANPLKAASEGEIKNDARHLAISDFALQKQDTELLLSLGTGSFAAI